MTKVSGATNQPHGFRMPTHDELVKAYRSIVDAREKSGDLKKLAKAPANASKYPSYNITKPGLLGVGREVYVIKGEMYLKTQVVSPNAKPTWYKVGPAPMF